MKYPAAIFVLLLSACATASPPIDKSKMAEGYYMKGLSFIQEKNYERASVEFNRSIQTDSDYKQSYYMLGIISDQRGQYDAAAAHYREAIDRDPDYSEAHNALGVVYSKQEKWRDAVKAFKKALENKLYTTPHIAYLNMGRAYMAQKDFDRAIEAYRDAKRHSRQDFIIYEFGSALFECGRIKESINEFRDGVALSPANANLRFSLALGLLKDGNRTAALTEFRKAAELAPESVVGQQAKDYLKTLR